MSLHSPTFVEALEVGRSRGGTSRDPSLWPALRACYPCVQGGGKTLYNVAGYDSNGNLTGMTPTSAWRATGRDDLPYGLLFDGVDDVVDCGAGSFDFTGSFSAVADIRVDTLGTDQRIVQNRGTGGLGTQPGWFLRLSASDNRVWLWVEGQDGSGDSSSGGTALSTGNYQVAGTFNGRTGQKIVYINGEEDYANTTPALIDAGFASGRNSTIGASLVSGVASQVFAGLIMNVVLFARVLTAEEVRRLYHYPVEHLRVRASSIAFMPPITPVSAAANSISMRAFDRSIHPMDSVEPMLPFAN